MLEVKIIDLSGIIVATFKAEKQRLGKHRSSAIKFSDVENLEIHYYHEQIQLMKDTNVLAVVGSVIVLFLKDLAEDYGMYIEIVPTKEEIEEDFSSTLQQLMQKNTKSLKESLGKLSSGGVNIEDLGIVTYLYGDWRKLITVKLNPTNSVYFVATDSLGNLKEELILSDLSESQQIRIADCCKRICDAKIEGN